VVGALYTIFYRICLFWSNSNILPKVSYRTAVRPYVVTSHEKHTFLGCFHPGKCGSMSGCHVYSFPQNPPALVWSHILGHYLPYLDAFRLDIGSCTLTLVCCDRPFNASEVSRRPSKALGRVLANLCSFGSPHFSACPSRDIFEHRSACEPEVVNRSVWGRDESMRHGAGS